MDEGNWYSFYRAVEQNPASIIITDINGNIEYVNPKFSTVTGYSAEEVIGRNPRMLKSGQTPSGNYRKLWDNLIAGREWHGEFCNRKKSGELFWEFAAISPITDTEGRISYFLGVKEDITERKEME